VTMIEQKYKVGDKVWVIDNVMLDMYYAFTVVKEAVIKTYFDNKDGKASTPYYLLEQKRFVPFYENQFFLSREEALSSRPELFEVTVHMDQGLVDEYL
jgi:hypothetical protein